MTNSSHEATAKSLENIIWQKSPAFESTEAWNCTQFDPVAIPGLRISSIAAGHTSSAPSASPLLTAVMKPNPRPPKNTQDFSPRFVIRLRGRGGKLAHSGRSQP
ncbi:hypothetical protein HPP92_023607 [Vanilla planifolia]|uniref:Uncharacterized protein n=1 Tax=Vanilla planifolia TaxID=51239 RepID=A0A835PQC8_VANPL|nr:hypothetical protein HPP92_023916 [Vanilla planifolia]KAG0455819.1 hypothetical protein HPP92_023607 [Vanilla planifolia]